MNDERTDVALVYGFNCWLITIPCHLFVFVLHLCTNTTFAIGKPQGFGLMWWLLSFFDVQHYCTFFPTSQLYVWCRWKVSSWKPSSVCPLQSIGCRRNACRQILIGWKGKCNALRGGLDGWLSWHGRPHQEEDRHSDDYLQYVPTLSKFEKG